MDAVQFTACGKRLQLSQLDIPKVSNPQDILIKVAYAGICGTDLHILQGEFTCKKDGPITLGHEFSGTVEEVGQGVQTLKKGDLVAVDPNNGCHCCTYCHSGLPHYCDVGNLKCTIGLYLNGGWAQYSLVHEEQVIKLHETITLEQAVLCEPLSCIAHGFDSISPISIGSKILILGAGIAGNLWATLLHLHGHKKVTISEFNESRRNIMKKSNLNYSVVAPDELKNQQNEKGAVGFDIVIDCTGNPQAIQDAIDWLSLGGKFLIFGVAPPDGKITISPKDIFQKELKIIGTRINPYTFPKCLNFIEALGDCYLKYDNIGVKTFNLQNFENAIEELKKGSIAKAVFKMP